MPPNVTSVSALAAGQPDFAQAEEILAWLLELHVGFPEHGHYPPGSVEGVLDVDPKCSLVHTGKWAVLSFGISFPLLPGPIYHHPDSNHPADSHKGVHDR